MDAAPLSTPAHLSPLVSPGLVSSGLRHRGGRRSAGCRRSLPLIGDERRGSAAITGAPLALAAVLIVMAVLVAPEQPEAQEAICQRHNGVAACRVW